MTIKGLDVGLKANSTQNPFFQQPVKPNIHGACYGTAEAVPLQSKIQGLRPRNQKYPRGRWPEGQLYPNPGLKPCPFKTKNVPPLRGSSSINKRFPRAYAYG
jgi:hypothetical protein